MLFSKDDENSFLKYMEEYKNDLIKVVFIFFHIFLFISRNQQHVFHELQLLLFVLDIQDHFQFF